MILFASSLYAYAVIRVQKKIPHVDGIAINGVAMVITALVYLPFVIANHPATMPSAKVLASVTALGLFPTAMAFILFFILIKEIGPARGSLVTYLNTAFAILLGVILLGEPLTLGIALGLPLVLIGSYFASRRPQTTSL
jgi:drug/metabolite transporter (DMT)-like permease